MARTKRIKVTTEEKVLYQRTTYVEIDMEFVQVYKAMAEMVAKLDGDCAKDLCLFLMFRTTKDNKFSYTRALYEDFNAHKMRCTDGKKEYAERTVKKALSDLEEKKIICRIGRGFYEFNPYLMWKDVTKEREKYLANLENKTIDIHGGENPYKIKLNTESHLLN